MISITIITLSYHDKFPPALAISSLIIGETHKKKNIFGNIKFNK